MRAWSGRRACGSGIATRRGKTVEREFEGLWATSVQHQIDHLDGNLYIDRLSALKRGMLIKKATKRTG